MLILGESATSAAIFLIVIATLIAKITMIFSIGILWKNVYTIVYASAS